MRLLRVILALLLIAMLCGCTKEVRRDPGTPEGIAKKFSNAIGKGYYEVAWDCLSKDGKKIWNDDLATFMEDNRQYENPLKKHNWSQERFATNVEMIAKETYLVTAIFKGENRQISASFTVSMEDEVYKIDKFTVRK